MKAEIYHQKRQAVAGKYVLGIDPGKRQHCCWVFGPSGSAIGNHFRIPVSHHGYGEVLWSQLSRRLPGFTAENLVVAVETSCNLWVTIAHFLYGRGFQVLQVSPLTTKQTRAVVNHDFSKSDPKDAWLVADNAQKGYYDLFRVFGSDLEAAHRLSITYAKLQKDRLRVVGRLTSFMERAFPEYLNVLDIDTKTSLELLSRHFLPQHFLVLDLQAEGHRLWKVSRGHHGCATLEQLRDLAKISIGLPLSDQQEAYRIVLDTWLDELRAIDVDLAKVEKALIQYGSTDRSFPILTSIPGIGENLAAQFVAETRGPGRFTHCKQIEKLAGLNLRLRESGNTSGARSINGIGNKRLRHVIYQMNWQTAKLIPQVRRRFLVRELKHPCYRKNLLACSSSLLRLIVALIKQNRPYEPRPELRAALRPLEQQYRTRSKPRRSTPSKASRMAA